MPDSMSDNFDELRDDLEELVESIDFTRTGTQESLGKTLLGIVHEGISDRNRSGVDPEGVGWPDNRGEYGERKRGVGIPVGVGLYARGRIGGEMLSLVQVIGEVTIEPDSARSDYGVTDDARDKGNWFTYGSAGPQGLRSGAAGQPPRPFYEMNEDDETAIMEAAAKWLDEILA
jgi:hypothetical protein